MMDCVYQDKIKRSAHTLFSLQLFQSRDLRFSDQWDKLTEGYVKQFLYWITLVAHDVIHQNIQAQKEQCRKFLARRQEILLITTKIHNLWPGPICKSAMQTSDHTAQFIPLRSD